MRLVLILAIATVMGCGSTGGWIPGGGNIPAKPMATPPPPTNIPPAGPKEKRLQYEAQIVSTRLIALSNEQEDGREWWHSTAGYDFNTGRAELALLEWTVGIRNPGATNRLYSLVVSGEARPFPDSPCAEGDKAGDLVHDPRPGHAASICVVPTLSVKLGDLWTQAGPVPVPPPEYGFQMPADHSFTVAPGSKSAAVQLLIGGSQLVNLREFHLFVDETTVH